MTTEEKQQKRIEGLETELADLTEELSRRYEELCLVYDISATMGTILDEEKLPIEVLNKAMDTLEVQRGYLMLFNEETFTLEVRVARGFEPDVLNKFKSGFKPDQAIGGQALREGKPINISDLTKVATKHNEGVLNLKSLLCVPLKYKDEPIGVIGLADKSSGQPFFAPDIKLVVALATQVSIIMQNARLFNQLQDLFVATISSLTFAIDEKDAYTHGHSDRVTQYSVETGRALGLSERNVNILELAAALHDVGKIGISDAVLGKPGKLTEEEWNEIKKHPTKGVNILRPVQDIQEALLVTRRARLLVPKEDIKQIVPGIKHHHERYDGKGYPDGLIGENIPLLARIIAVADAYDAMTSKRSYRDALTEEQAMAELKKNAGIQHDPNIVEAFLQLREEEKRKKKEKEQQLKLALT